jgi:trans-aconitate methyltransferase
MNRQEDHWAGEFGTAYTNRNLVQWADRIPFWQRILWMTDVGSILDVGCNAGWNQLAIESCDPDVSTFGIDINLAALGDAKRAGMTVEMCRAADVADQYGNGAAELVCHSGVLIHVPPADLPRTMRAIYDATSQWVLAVEYASLKEEEVLYRGEKGLLWKRPFGDLYADLGLREVAHGEAIGFDRCYFWLMSK